MRHVATAALGLGLVLAACGQQTTPPNTASTLTVTIDAPRATALAIGGPSGAGGLGQLQISGAGTLRFQTDQFIVRVTSPVQDAALRTFLRSNGGRVLKEGTIPARPDGKAPLNDVRSGEYKLVSLMPPATSVPSLQNVLDDQHITGDVHLDSPAAAATYAFAQQGFKALGLSAGLNVVAQAQQSAPGSPYNLYSLDGTYTDPSGSAPYQHRAVDLWWLGYKGVNALPAWSNNYQGQGVGVAIIDQGMNFDYDMTGYNPRTNSNPPYWRNVWQYDFENGSYREFNMTPGQAGDAWHGQLVADFAAAAAGNQYGIAGVAPAANVMLFKTGLLFGGTNIYDACTAVNTAVNWGARVINLSWGFFSPGGTDPSLCLSPNIAAADQKGVVVVAAAGNFNGYYEKARGQASSTFIPAAFPWVIGVGGTLRDGTRDIQSDYGPIVDLSAPSNDGLVGAPTPEQACWTSNHCAFTTQESSKNVGGTSFSSPMVAGAVALVLQKYPSYNRAQVLSLLQRTGTRSGGTFGPSGPLRVNVGAALGVVGGGGPQVAPALP